MLAYRAPSGGDSVGICECRWTLFIDLYRIYIYFYVVFICIDNDDDDDDDDNDDDEEEKEDDEDDDVTTTGDSAVQRFLGNNVNWENNFMLSKVKVITC